MEAEAGPAAWMDGEHVRDVSGDCQGRLDRTESKSRLRNGERKLRNGERSQGSNFEMESDGMEKRNSNFEVESDDPHNHSASEQPSSEKKSEPGGDESP